MNVPALNILPSEQQRFGRYKLLCKLGSGGMATLYLARFASDEGFEKHVAIKRIHDHLSEEEEFLQMFVDEARLAAQISHPHVAQVIEFGAQPAHFIAMEYVDGESLTAFIRRAQPPLVVCARIVAQAAAGLHAAHELRSRDGELLGVVHRDVSPHNILISYEGVVKVVDFGVARARGNLHTTTVGTVKGKFAYMSPEQARMEPVDRRSDIFALGIVLYEISTRYRLFKAPNEAATVAKVLHADIVPPSALVEDYPKTLERIVLKALSRDPEERYESAEEMQAALEAFIVEQGSALLPSALAALMRQTFEERINEKRALMQSAEVQGDLSDEVDLGSSPSLTMGGATVSVAQHEAAQRRRRRRLLLGAVATVAIVAIGGLGALLFDLLAEAPEGARGVSAPIPPVLASKPAASPLSREVTIEIRATPALARISLAGKNVGNPYKGRQAARPGEAEVVVSAEGYEPKRVKVSLARGGFFSIALERVASAGGDADKVPEKSAIASPSKAKTAGRGRGSKGRPGRKKKGRRRRPKERNGSELFGNPYGS